MLTLKSDERRDIWQAALKKTIISFTEKQIKHLQKKQCYDKVGEGFL